MAFRNSASFGKRQEYIAVAELLKRGFDVYMTLVDDQGIDCIIRLDKSGLKYLDIQIKARSESAKNAATFAAMTIPDPRKNYFFIFYSELADLYWVIPSLELVKLANVGKSGANKGKYRIDLTGKRKKDGTVSPKGKWKKYENAFGLLK